jgi:hemolysin activation/secretion protein
VDNYRSPVIGSLERGVSAAVRNLTGYGDLLEGTITESPQERSSTRGSVAWRMPLNSFGTDLTLRYEKGQSTVIEAPLDTLEIDSLFETREIGLSQVLYESLRHKVSVGASYTERENDTYLLGESFSFIPGQADGHSESDSTRLWQEYTWRSGKQVLALRSTFSTVETNRNASSGLPAGLPPADDSYDTWTGQFVYVHKVMENGAQISLRGTLQDSDTGLLPTDDFALGGVSTIRGYRENQFTFDEGHLLNLEFEYPLLKAGRDGLSLSLRPFIDYGRGRNVDADPDTISSAGLAMDAAWQGIEANLVYAERLSHPDFVDEQNDDWQDRGVHFRLAYRF